MFEEIRIMFSLRNALLAGLAVSAVAATAGQAAAQSVNDYNYIGVGGSDEGFVVNGKVTLTKNLSLRPAAMTEFDDFTVLIPVTYDFSPLSASAEDRLLPFAGAGVRIDTEGDNNFGLLVNGGADYRITDKWVANGSANVSFLGETEFDFILGVGYSF
jgi:opacity protein-like surface antigen